MGIPLFFKIISEKYDDIIQNELDKNNNNLFFDLNCLIHPCANRIIKNYYNSNKKILESKICNEVILYITKIIELSSASFIYIAIDGVAPFAKMIQQRQRRFKSFLEKTEINKIKTKLGIESDNFWDTNAISPGTDFMNTLSDKINNYILNNTFFENKTVIFSDSSYPGEGEHKIINYIKKNKFHENIIIYGLDADLIMLSLSCNCSSIFLLRENIVNGKVIENEYKYLNIDKLRLNLVKDYNNRYNKDHNNCSLIYNYNIIQDYIFICFFLGNDFIPHIVSLDLKYKGLDIIMDIYIYIHMLTDEYFIKDNKINITFLKMFVKKLSDSENETIKIFFNKRINYNKYFKIRANNELDKKLELLSNKPIIEMDKEFLITKNRFNSTTWRYDYYKHCLNINSKSEIQNLCKNYFEGIFWTFEYYFKHCPSWKWRYNYNYSPTLYDLNCYLENNKLDIKFISDKPVKPIVQLLFILPKKSIDILPEKYKKYMTDYRLGLTHLYPESYELSLLFKRYYWQCTPVLPKIENELISLIK